MYPFLPKVNCPFPSAGNSFNRAFQVEKHSTNPQSINAVWHHVYFWQNVYRETKYGLIGEILKDTSKLTQCATFNLGFKAIAPPEKTNWVKIG